MMKRFMVWTIALAVVVSVGFGFAERRAAACSPVVVGQRFAVHQRRPVRRAVAFAPRAAFRSARFVLPPYGQRQSFRLVSPGYGAAALRLSVRQDFGLGGCGSLLLLR